jgi:hypothetical protein
MSEVIVESGQPVVVPGASTSIEPVDLSPPPVVSVGGGNVTINYYSDADVNSMILEHDAKINQLEEDVAEIYPNEPGKSAYELAVDAGFVGSLDDWLDSLQGSPGFTSGYGPPPDPLPSGYSAGAMYLDIETYQLYRLG